MNFGKTVLELRKAKNVTQEEMAAELGVTAAAVSKWENNYTLPDILMLCALADYFGVTTDELLGRNGKRKFAVIAAKNQELGQRIAALAEKNCFTIHGIFTDYQEAKAAALTRPEVTHLFASMDGPLPEEDKAGRDDLFFIESQSPDLDKAVGGFQIYFDNIDKMEAIAVLNK